MHSLRGFSSTRLGRSATFLKHLGSSDSSRFALSFLAFSLSFFRFLSRTSTFPCGSAAAACPVPCRSAAAPSTSAEATGSCASHGSCGRNTLSGVGGFSLCFFFLLAFLSLAGASTSSSATVAPLVPLTLASAGPFAPSPTLDLLMKSSSISSPICALGMSTSGGGPNMSFPEPPRFLARSSASACKACRLESSARKLSTKLLLASRGSLPSSADIFGPVGSSPPGAGPGKPSCSCRFCRSFSRSMATRDLRADSASSRGAAATSTGDGADTSLTGPPRSMDGGGRPAVSTGVSNAGILAKLRAAFLLSAT
mmetsp:Transcript_24766/g.67998  ORF Transcript_24766/g.67998 Transcript_24766/m.67998 type:complete len:311 (-) Transcript_24766:119-1051(-)